MSKEYQYEGFANLFKGIEVVGGKLYLTKNVIIHSPHKFNIQSRETIIDLKDITEVTTRNTFLLVPNGILLTTKDGENYKLVVNKRKSWMEKINLLRRQH
ncbi:hypothetical protein J2R98_000363 [Alkalibacillus filiformis]|uniref:GRAM domain-containing protein n=1 Tax=Alkalibacillus filiformis TaxID=200990 RepID=A0ABU0DQS6_9BACI|nr:GRAM domain-containing protein [Alkalibacillus filiformis]MDQ0350560.1 hypothetical protein [Alkalibacillus filiformis]